MELRHSCLVFVTHEASGAPRNVASPHVASQPTTLLHLSSQPYNIITSPPQKRHQPSPKHHHQIAHSMGKFFRLLTGSFRPDTSVLGFKPYNVMPPRYTLKILSYRKVCKYVNKYAHAYVYIKLYMNLTYSFIVFFRSVACGQSSSGKEPLDKVQCNATTSIFHP